MEEVRQSRLLPGHHSQPQVRPPPVPAGRSEQRRSLAQVEGLEIRALPMQSINLLEVQTQCSMDAVSKLLVCLMKFPMGRRNPLKRTLGRFFSSTTDCCTLGVPMVHKHVFKFGHVSVNRVCFQGLKFSSESFLSDLDSKERRVGGGGRGRQLTSNPK